ncbi:soluble lytic murein transglycosylase and related regulatory protein [Tepidicaulis marinus]|uniref:Soluble lytic murein transglycosylase and related regulatory protein n=1 Tax=Tepidicaulis marinus TaxID=1333998 RepID=A0A081BCD3_9HYPH|nr:lytic transglycosylase domain-containing protein [Tepidicaulis marinus]GAK45701.1 soluble lytic murein transglycosylase and related regulatory protein [Tepidicaulis marinus]
MKRALVTSLLCMAIAGFAQSARADAGALLQKLDSDWSQCRYAAQQMERMSGIPKGLLTSISMVETGRRAPGGKVEPWPWTINVEGRGYYYTSKAEAIRAVRRLMAAGSRSIDVGCMQVNLRFHPRAFTSLEEAFDPDANVAYAASFLSELKSRSGSWDTAAGHYHSYSPHLNRKYSARIQKVWASEKTRAPLEDPRFDTLRQSIPGIASSKKGPATASSEPDRPRRELNIILRASLAHEPESGGGNTQNTVTVAMRPAPRVLGTATSVLSRAEERPAPQVIYPANARVAMR